jgi:hypothetical protein
MSLAFFRRSDDEAIRRRDVVRHDVPLERHERPGILPRPFFADNFPADVTLVADEFHRSIRPDRGGSLPPQSKALVASTGIGPVIGPVESSAPSRAS